jgi:hypothetical protein
MPKALKMVCGKLFRIFSRNKCAPANRTKGFYTSRLLKNHEIVEIFSIKQQRTWTSKELGSLLLKFKIKIINFLH